MAASTSSGFHTHSSWGRTRRPKTVSTVAKSAAPGGTLETARVVAASEVGDLAANLDSGTEGQNGYATENQRFLHVTVSAANNKSVKIYVYNYAIRVWSALMVNDGDGTFSQASQRALPLLLLLHCNLRRLYSILLERTELPL